MAKLIYGWSCLGAERMRALAQTILRSSAMCRNIRPLFNFEPPATGNEMHDAALQFVRKISGYTHPSQSNQAAFEEAVEDIEKVVKKLLKALETNAPPRDREVVAAKARERAKLRYG